MNKTFFKAAFASPLVIIIAMIAIININLNYDEACKIADGDTVHCLVLQELRGLRQAIDKGADADMQSIYPEGYVFMNAIYGLAWCNFLEKAGQQSPFLRESFSEISSAWSRIDSDLARSTFDEDLPLAHGAYYTGWSAYLLGRKLELTDSSSRSIKEIKQFQGKCAHIALAIQNGPYPLSYAGGAWPADATVCVAALALHDRIFDPLYDDVIQQWVTNVKGGLDPNGMIPHSVHPTTGVTIEKARGSSQSLILVFLMDIDRSFAAEQYARFKIFFPDTLLGLTGIREYAKGDSGSGDIDSGPVIFGFGGAATIVGMQTLSAYGEQALSLRIRSTVEAFGFPMKMNGRKRYLFGSLPIADAFIAWSHSAIPPARSDYPFYRFRAYSLLTCLFLSLFFWTLVKSETVDSDRTLHIPW